MRHTQRHSALYLDMHDPGQQVMAENGLYYSGEMRPIDPHNAICQIWNLILVQDDKRNKQPLLMVIKLSVVEQKLPLGRR